MNQFKNVFLFLIILSFSVSGQTLNSMDNFANKIVKTFQNNDYNNFKQLCVSKENYFNEILPEIRNDSTHHIPKAMLQKGSIFFERNSDDLKERMYDNCISQGTKLGITDWKKIQFKKIEIEKTNPKVDESKTLIGSIWFTYNDQTYAIIGVIAVHLSVGYRLTVIRGIVKS